MDSSKDSYQSSQQTYDTSTLADLTEAFETTWEVLQAHDPFRDWEQDDELRLALTGKLLALATDGLTDPEQLRSLALESLPLGRSARFRPRPLHPSAGRKKSSAQQSLSSVDSPSVDSWIESFRVS
jgi:hypothetical protein